MESTPPGAAVLLDGVDTGRRTPALLVAPGPGEHRLLLRLEGYADEEERFDEPDPFDLGFSRTLRPRAEVEHEEATRRAATRAVSPAERDATRAFLGRARSGASVTVQLSYFPGRSLTTRVGGDGTAEVRWASAVHRTQGLARLRLPPADVARIFGLLVEVGWTGAVSAERQGGEDEPRLRITVTNAAGRSVALEKWIGDAHPRFDPVFEALERVRDQLPESARKEIAR